MPPSDSSNDMNNKVDIEWGFLPLIGFILLV